VGILPDSLADTALARLFAKERREGAATWFSLPGGAHLFQAEAPADHLYFLRAGRLGAFRQEEGQERQFLGIIRPGEAAGEMALIAGAPHTATVVALRDSEILALPRTDFFAAAEQDPHVMTELAQMMIARLRQDAAGHSPMGDPSVFGFIAAEAGPPVRPMVEGLAGLIEAMGYSVDVAGGEALMAPTEWFSSVEQAHDFVLYVAEHGQGPWAQVVGRQVDHLFRVARGKAPPSKIEPYASEPLLVQHLVDLIMLRPPGASAAGSAAWQDASGAARIFHLIEGDLGGLQRLARIVTGQSVGLALSGGGARAYAHIGAIRALRERDIPVDFVGGSSMGAIVGAGLALGWSDDEMERRVRQAFVDSSPLDDIAIPLIAMTQGNKVRERLAEHFDGVDIADMALPFFCVSSNLTTGAYQLHRRGDLARALRASISLPGVLPPVTDGANVLVDGAVMKNFPADIMRAMHLGPIVGVDVTRGRSITAKDVFRPPSLWKWIASGDWRSGPPIVGLLMRAATVSTGRDLAASRQATDVLITPKLEGVDIRNWRAYEPAVEAGYAAACAALDALDSPVQTLRRRKSHWEETGTTPIVFG
jgi:NTE family protein